MARIIKKNSDLHRKYHSYQTKKAFTFLISGSFLVLCMLHLASAQYPNLAYIFILFIGFVGGIFAGKNAKKKADICRAGLEGEKTTAQIMEILPDTYCGFQNIEVAHKGKTSELDMVVVGPTGVFIIETKNHNGMIVGNYDSPQWVQKKVGRGGGSYSKSFYNPIKQVGTHVYRLANYLRKNGCSVHVNAMVYFSNSEAVIQLSGTPGEIPVYVASRNGAREVCSHILKNDQSISEKGIREIRKLLNA